MARDIEAEIDRLRALVDDLLLLARTDSGVVELAVEPIDLAEVALDAAGRSLAAAAGRARRPRSRSTPSPSRSSGDPARLRQLVTILVDNAIRHAPAGSTVDVGVDGGRAITARLRVEDDGPGFRPEDLPRVFDRFWRAGRARAGGTGLGLAHRRLDRGAPRRVDRGREPARRWRPPRGRPAARLTAPARRGGAGRVRAGSPAIERVRRKRCAVSSTASRAAGYNAGSNNPHPRRRRCS